MFRFILVLFTAGVLGAMVQAITADEEKFDLQKWEARWAQAQESSQ